MPYPDSEYPSILRGKDKRESERLLAAAPEMLSALHDTLGELEWLCECHRKCKEEPDEGACAAIAKARAVILKAEGRG